MEEKKYWYEVSIPTTTDPSVKALNYLRLLCQSIIIKHTSPLRNKEMTASDRGMLYLIMPALITGRKIMLNPEGWEISFISILKEVATELVNEKAFDSQQSFYQSLLDAINNVKDSDERLKFFNLKIKERYEVLLPA